MARTPQRAENRMNRPEKLARNASPHLASRMDGIEPFHVMALIARARELEAQGRTVSNMVVGEPDAPTRAVDRRGRHPRHPGRPGRLYPVAGHHRVARSDIEVVPHALRRGSAALADRRDHRLLGRAVADDGCDTFARRPGADDRSRLSVQPALRTHDGGRSGRHPGGGFDRLPAHRQEWWRSTGRRKPRPC